MGLASMALSKSEVCWFQRWEKQAGEHRRNQPLDMAKTKHNGRLNVPDNALGVKSDDTGDPSVRPHLSSFCMRS